MEIHDYLPADGLEWRRFQALHLKRQGWSRHDIAEGHRNPGSRGRNPEEAGGREEAGDIREHFIPGVSPAATARTRVTRAMRGGRTHPRDKMEWTKAFRGPPPERSLWGLDRWRRSGGDRARGVSGARRCPSAPNRCQYASAGGRPAGRFRGGGAPAALLDAQGYGAVPANTHRQRPITRSRPDPTPAVRLAPAHC